MDFKTPEEALLGFLAFFAMALVLGGIYVLNWIMDGAADSWLVSLLKSVGLH